jgi:hypothetical protein
LEGTQKGWNLRWYVCFEAHPLQLQKQQQQQQEKEQ